MNQYDWISIITLSGWLILALGAFQARRMNARTTIVMALAWGAIFLLVVAVFAAVS